MGQGLLADNPHARFFNGQRGYGLCRFTRDRCEVAYRVVSHVSRPDGVVSTAGRFVVEAGRGGVLPG
jgi:alkaline phosphatase D